ncbi:outer membrane beta-barrel protein [Marinobacter salinisoli]|uniref:Outer membrane beta-barrel protein n=1 Tax=Marinobacter salinisoli TaxID=2769486 RepID=A0ABX7MSF0_9GAMM|nr:outer membrane beta-barrel protein [Marinobacter salinisoli]QSP94427.1 outer membrane beta-barrel protein [Marinobacter salinisoli]
MKWRRFVVLGLLVLAFHGQAFGGQPGGGYIGFSLGQATFEDFCDGSESTCDDGAVSFRAYGGTRLTDVVSFELGYRFIDEIEASGVVNGDPLALGVEGHLFDTSVQLGVPASGPLQVHTRVGLVLWHLNYEVFAIDRFGPFSVTDDDSGFALRGGLGVTFDVSRSLRLRADWDLYLDVGDRDEFGESDINVFSVGPEFRF